MSISQFNKSTPPLVAPLSFFQRDDVALAGGKGANLGELFLHGFEVPPGFVITTAAYDFLLQSNNVYAGLLNKLTALDFEDLDTVAEISKKIRDLFQHIPIPGQITEQILTTYRHLDNDPVAVRSSATAEDLPGAAFAGQQETFLNVIGEKALLEAVRACWRSLWSERALVYRARQKVDQTSVKLAVVVQKMIPADVAGVMFTANPVSGARDELVIDANPGLGEAVVSGLVTPDHFVVNKRSRHVKEKQLGRREVIFRAKKEGGTEQLQVSKEFTRRAALSTTALRQLSQLGIEIEHHYGGPQDIEWAWIQDHARAGKFYVLQARPMTALPEPLHLSGPMRLVIPMLAEMWPARPYPLDMTTFTGAIERAIGNLLVTMIGKSAPSPDQAFLEEDGVILQFQAPQVHPSPSMLFTPLIAIWQTRHSDLSHWEADPLVAEFITKSRALESRDLRASTWDQNLETLHESLALLPQVMNLRERYFPKALLGLAGLWLFLALARRSHEFGTLLSGVRTKTTETNEALETLAAQIRTDPALQELFLRNSAQTVQTALQASAAGQVFLKRFEEFLEAYGHRETTLTISQPAWKDHPDNVFAILKVLAESEPTQTNRHTVWQARRDEILAHSILGTRLLRTLFLKSLTNARSFFQIREDTHFYATLVQPTIRHVTLELGERLRQAGALDEAEEVFHLQLQELEAAGQPWPPSEGTITQLRTLVARRKAKREGLANRPMIDPRLLTIASQNQSGADVLLRGSAGSPGIAQGPARIILDVSEFSKLKAGDILVAPVTNPAWTPLFQRAVAVVVDTGGSASHAAIVAREYGIPAVMGTMNGTKVIKDGQWIQVDGGRGQVIQIEEHK